MRSRAPPGASTRSVCCWGSQAVAGMAWGFVLLLLPSNSGELLFGPLWHAASALLVPTTLAMGAASVYEGAFVGRRALGAPRRSACFGDPFGRSGGVRARGCLRRRRGRIRLGRAGGEPHRDWRGVAPASSGPARTCAGGFRLNWRRAPYSRVATSRRRPPARRRLRYARESRGGGRPGGSIGR